MTQMLASVTSLTETSLALAAAVDIVDFKNPEQGALGALPLETVRALIRYIDHARPTSATVGDLPMDPDRVLKAAEAMRATGVDYVKIGFFAGPRRTEVLAGLSPLCAQGTRVVIVMFADQEPDPALLSLIAESGCAGVMLDTASKSGRGLRGYLCHEELKAFVVQARAVGLLVGLAGSLQIEDIPHLLPLQPDYLGFRGALCAGSVRTRKLDINAMRRVRALIPKTNLQYKPNLAGVC
jgi:Uncharacterized protein conserved in archaea